MGVRGTRGIVLWCTDIKIILHKIITIQYHIGFYIIYTNYFGKIFYISTHYTYMYTYTWDVVNHIDARYHSRENLALIMHLGDIMYRVWLLACLLMFVSGVYVHMLYVGNEKGKEVVKVIKEIESSSAKVEQEQTALNKTQQDEKQVKTITVTKLLVKYVKDKNNTKCISSPNFVQLYNTSLLNKELKASSGSDATNTK